jgi:hypothetical protein
VALVAKNVDRREEIQRDVSGIVLELRDTSVSVTIVDVNDMMLGGPYL